MKFLLSDKMKSAQSNLVNPGTQPVFAWVLLFALSLIWGTSYILIKKGLVAFSPLQVASIRMGITALVFLPLFVIRFKQFDWSKWKTLAFVGVTGSLLPALLFASAQTKVDSALAGILSSLTPLFTLLLGISFFGIKASWSKIGGVILGFAGTACLLLFDGSGGRSQGFMYGALVVAGTMLYAISNNVVKCFLHSMGSVSISVVSYLMVGLPATCFLFFSGFFEVFSKNEHAWASLGYLAILSLLGTVVASVMLFKLIKETSALFASTVSYLVPVIAIFWGLTDGELVTTWQLIGMALILMGIYASGR